MYVAAFLPANYLIIIVSGPLWCSYSPIERNKYKETTVPTSKLLGVSVYAAKNFLQASI